MKRVAAVAIAGLLVGEAARADLENQVFTSKSDAIRLVIPRGWRATDQASYPGLLLWLMHAQPDAKIALTVEPFTRSLFCSWPVQCQASHDSLAAKYACAMRVALEKQSFHVGPTQIGPKDNELAGLPSVWFEYDDGSHFLRQAVAMDQTHAVSLILSAAAADARSSYVRAFEQTLRTLRPLTADELKDAVGASAGASAGSGSDAGSGSGSSAGSGSAAGDGSAAKPDVAAGSDAIAAANAKPPSVNPVGACHR
nr:hypothetical protein [Kofleriaceae bacterium]